MTHLTLNTGHSMTVPPGKVGREAIRLLSHMVSKGGDMIPRFSPWRAVIARSEGCASFDIRRGRDQLVVLNAVAWTHAGAVEAWAILERHYLNVSDALAHQGLALDLEMPEMPAALPWLVTWILPTATQIANPNDLGWMADFEQCLAATIIQKSTNRTA